MKRILSMLAVVTVVGAAWAGDPEFTYEIPHIPDELVPDVDGDLNDSVWANYPMEYAIVHPGGDISLANGRGIGSVAPDASNYSVTIKWGWNDTTNKLYFAIDEFDDVYYVDTPAEWWTDDVWQIYTDAKLWNDWYQYNGAIAEEEWGSHAQQWEFTQGEHWWGTETNINLENPKTNQVPTQEPWAKVAFTNPPSNGDQNVNLKYEIYLTVWEFIDPSDNANSIPWDMEEGQTMGLLLSRYEDDEGGATLNVEWQTGGAYEVQNSSTFSEVFLLEPGAAEWPKAPTAVESSTWGWVKSLF